MNHEIAADAQGQETNLLLQSLTRDDYMRLRAELVPERLELNRMLVVPHERVRDVWFIREGVGSVLAVEQQGGEIEVGTVGNEGFVGLPALLGDTTSPYRVLVQVPGDGWRLSAESLRRLATDSEHARTRLLRYVNYYVGQVAQSVACNRLHTLEERCARWLAMTRDRVNGDQFTLTHEHLSAMLGVRRAGVTVAMGVMQRAGLVKYVRGRVTVLDRAGLEEAACDCYGIVRAERERLLGPVEA